MEKWQQIIIIVSCYLMGIVLGYGVGYSQKQAEMDSYAIEVAQLYNQCVDASNNAIDLANSCLALHDIDPITTRLKSLNISSYR